ncbi:uncharacterized protein LOC132069246 isoform X2 [Lycium ferocissimum]|uniref:uncharacterized protein LOC132069246 isoform X2 n=1 Tax=Lycium ferocissimum TaxID=112874 RepID=UPI0028151CB6|nr:uncharacterized protein LOC132069246 isoform X2 [Lycium ferocissimum]
MSSKLSPVCLIILFFITTNPVGRGQSQTLGVGLGVGVGVGLGVGVEGSLACTPTGNPPGPGIAGADVRVSCDGGNTTLLQMTTSSNGSFSGTLNVTVLVSTNTMTPCQVIVDTPIANCPVLGRARAPLIPISSIISNPIGLTIKTVVGPFLRA